MKNTILNYETEDVELEDGVETSVSDYFSKDVQIFNLLDDLDDYIDTYQINNTDKLERIAYELYGNSDYWDILLMLNDRNPLFEMSYDYDLLANYSLERTNFYKQVLYSHPPLETARSEALFDEIETATVALNEEYRTIFIIKPEKMNNFITLLKEQSFI